MDIPHFATKKETIDFLISNKDTIITSKKSKTKQADGIGCIIGGSTSFVDKAVTDGATEIRVKAIINTTNLIDSHGDLHVSGIWTKALKENRNILFLQEHEMRFDKIIADGKSLNASVETFTFKELGFNLDGTTDALVFDATVKMSRNAYMFNQYSMGQVKNHSVGMQYVKMALAVNDEEYPTEKNTWDKYYPLVANKNVADDKGYFWVVQEAKVIEGSAVPIGSNYATPTILTESLTDAQSNKTQSQISTEQAQTIINELFKSIKL